MALGLNFNNLATLISLALVCCVAFLASVKDTTPRITRLIGVSLYHAYKFVNTRYGFMRSAIAKAPLFQFWVVGKRVIGLSGDSGRRLFFGQKVTIVMQAYVPLISVQGLKFDQAYSELNFPSPEVHADNFNVGGAECDCSGQDQDPELFSRRLQLLLSDTRVSAILPALLDDIHSQTRHFAHEGSFNPFNDVYNTVFRMTVRMASCRSLAEDNQCLNQLGSLYEELNTTCTALGIIAPWLPIWGASRRTKIVQEMSQIVGKFVVERSQSEALQVGEDTIDILLCDGMDILGVVNFVMRLIFAGTINTGMNACWLLMFLAKDTTWKDKVTSEILQIISKHTTLPATSPLHRRLSSIPVNAWENDMPLLDQAIRETLRLVMAHVTGLRKNVLQDISFGDVIIPRNSFLAYVFADAHLDPNIYTEPLKFDPDRFSPARSEEKKAPHAYLAWGSGRHPCPGSRIAKLELRIIVAYFLAGYDFELVDRNGAPLIEVPEPNYDTLSVLRPMREVFLKYTANPAVIL
ncbi:cytochrome P450 [Imleria badia]|nr:cytochrome P450 [Imleria badia]